MKTLARCLIVALFALTTMPQSTEAATPKDGRYKGTLTFRTQVDGTKAEAKKVIPMAGILSGGTLLLVITEIPKVGSYFTSITFNSAVSDGSVVLYPNGNAQSVTLFNVKTTTAAIKGNTDFGVFGPPTGSGSARIFMDFAVTRVGN